MTVTGHIWSSTSPPTRALADRAAANEIRIAILGTVEVVGAARTTSLPGTNLPTLLSLLALSPGRPVPNERLTSALWPDADPARSSRSLISLVHQLNAMLAMQLGLDRAVVSVKSVGRALRVDPNMIDVVQFERRLADADVKVASGQLDDAVETYESALGLWRGEPFGGIDLPCLVEPSAHLRVARMRGEAALIDASLRTGRGAALVPWLMQRVDAEPFDEHAAADAARALYQAGRSSDALDVLRACMDELRRRRIEPGATIRRLELDVLDHSLDHPPVSPIDASRVADADDDGFVGRHAERSSLDAWHEGAAESSVMVIDGEAGIGKTAVIDAWLDGRHSDELVVRGRCSPAQTPALEPFAGLVGRAGDAPAGLSTSSPQVQFDEVVRRVTSPSAPVGLLVIDDAQWLTVTSIALLRHLLWHADVERLHVVLAIRTPQTTGDSALARLLSDLERERRAHHVHLPPLGRAEIERLAARHGARAVDGERLLWLTGGNPLFAINSLRAAGPDADLDDVDVTLVVQDALAHYLEPLSAASRRIMQAAARRGLEGDAGQLAMDAGASELEVMDALDEVGGGRLMHVEPIGGSYRFVHELARRSVLTGVTQPDEVSA